MRLINADALIKSIKECVEAKDANCEWEQVQGLECALECIDEEPTVQPVVRCKDCKHRDPEDKKCDCGHDILWQLPREDNWYCADAKRRTDADMRGEQE